MTEKHFFGKVAVKAVIVKDGKVLICRDGRDGDRWEVPGGRINEGESLEAAIVREVREELGVSVKVIRLLHSEQSLHFRDNAMILFAAFEVMLDGVQDIIIQPGGEITEVKWIGKDGAGEHKFYPDILNALRAYWKISSSDKAYRARIY